MQSSKEIEEFAGQKILALDPRTEKIARACAACGSTDARPLGIKNELDIVSCRKCASVYTPYSPWYSSEYYYVSYYTEDLSTPAFLQKRLEEITAEFSPYRQTNRLLDVGCGAGNLLQAARKNGWNAQGLDVAPNSVKHVRSLGFEVFQGELQQANFPAGHFDVITAAELLEHLPDPRSLLEEVARVLRPGGLFWTTTPHARGLSSRVLGINWRCVWPPEHLQLFSVGGLKSLLDDVGFRNIRVRTTGGNPLEIFHALGAKKDGPKTEDQHFDRVVTGYQLNESLMKSRPRRMLRDLVNGVLNISRLGDTLKIFATK
jgi:SAM-dependent methyltransferase